MQLPIIFLRPPNFPQPVSKYSRHQIFIICGW